MLPGSMRLCSARAAGDVRQRDGWDRLGGRPGCEVPIAVCPADEAVGGDGACGNEGNEADRQEPAGPRRFDRLRGQAPCSPQAAVGVTLTATTSAVVRS